MNGTKTIIVGAAALLVAVSIACSSGPSDTTRDRAGASASPVDPNAMINKQVADYVAASQQAANRAQQFYQQPTGDQQAATTANASANLASAAAKSAATACRAFQAA